MTWKKGESGNPAGRKKGAAYNSARKEMSEIQWKMDKIVKSGGRVPANDPLVGRMKKLRNIMKNSK